ncbi:MAG TPA: nuclear transport factor 2 family protein [Thermoleophilaceae bacterium]
MSRQNVELVRHMHQAFNRRDTETFLGLLDPHVEWVPMMARLEGTVYRGRAEVERWLAGLDHDWVDLRTEPREFRDLGDVVLILGSWHARARTSGVVLDSEPAAWVARIRHGKVVRQETFTDQDQAFEAARRQGRA